MFMCKECKHKKVCKNREEFEKTLEVCENFDNENKPKTYGNIYSMFDPIFEWIKTHYPSGEVKFWVDSRSAIMFHEHKVSVYDKEIREFGKRISDITFPKDENKE